SEEGGMRLIRDNCPPAEFWSIVTDGIRFIHGKFEPRDNVWVIPDLDWLCEFIGGNITSNELRARAYLAEVEQVKEVRREEHIRRLAEENRNLDVHARELRTLYCKATETFTFYYLLWAELIIQLKSTVKRWPLVTSSRIRNILAEAEQKQHAPSGPAGN